MTRRAGGFLGAGAAAIVASRLFGVPALMPVGVAFALAPVLAFVWTLLVARSTRLSRRVDPVAVVAGEGVAVEVSRTGWPIRLRLGRALVWDVDPGVGGLSAMQVSRAPGGVVQVSGVRRGRHTLAPVVAVVRDPFGLSQRSIEVDDGAVVDVRPALLNAKPGETGPAPGRPGHASAGALVGSLDVVGTRAYRPGDRLNRINWRQTAKRGELQTLELMGDDPGRANQVVLLDAGPATRNGDPDFELAVATAATIADHLAHTGRLIAVEHSGLPGARVSSGYHVQGRVTECLTRLDGGGHELISAMVLREASTLGAGRGLIVVTSRPDPGLAAAAAAVIRGHHPLVIVLVGAEASQRERVFRREGARLIVGRSRIDLTEALIGEWGYGG